MKELYEKILQALAFLKGFEEFLDMDFQDANNLPMWRDADREYLVHGDEFVARRSMLESLISIIENG